MKKLQTTLNACVRFVVGNLQRRAHVTPTRLDLGWLSAYRRREYFIGLQVFTVLVNARPSYLVERFAYRQSIDLTVKRSERYPPQAFATPRRRTEAFKHSFALEAMNLINSFNVIDFSALQTMAFRRNLRAELFRRDQMDWAKRVRDEGLSRDLLRGEALRGLRPRL